MATTGVASWERERLMCRYRRALPQLLGGPFLTDSGLETDLIFNKGFELPELAAFHVLSTEEGRAELDRYFRSHAQIAVDHRVGFILESVTWRANPYWGRKIGYTEEGLREKNVEAVEFLEVIRADMETPSSPMVISGQVGPRSDGYVPRMRMVADEAARFHAVQIGTFAKTNADMVTAMTLNYVDEAIGIVWAAQGVDLPVVISFTVETDGRLPTGRSLAEAIEAVDAATDHGPAYYMINCAHPSHFDPALVEWSGWSGRVRAIRANASKMSHAELDESTELDTGDPQQLSEDYKRLIGKHGQINVLGGCCGTDLRHIAEIAKACWAVG